MNLTGDHVLSILRVILQFVLAASDPHSTCELVHRDPGVAGTYYLYCAQMSDDGIELIDVGRFVPDAAQRGVPPNKELP